MSRDDLDTLLRGIREREPDAPPFGRVWGAALERRAARRPRRRLAGAAAALGAVAVVVAVLMPAPDPQLADDPTPEARALAHSLSDWQGPLDFLLEPPGGSLFGLDPGSPALRLPADLSDLQIEEIL